jgi:dephospho-CoA kinase
MTLRVGLTGGLASGKSTVAALLAERGCRVIDADDVVAWLYESGRPGAHAVRRLFGPAVLDTAGTVDRARLAELVFADPGARRRLEAAIHPLVARRFEELAAAAAEAVVVLEATLLVEAGMADGFDLVVSVEAPAATRLARAVARGLPEAAARARLEAQGAGEVRLRRADRVIANDGDRQRLEGQVEDLMAELRQRSATGAGAP